MSRSNLDIRPWASLIVCIAFLGCGAQATPRQVMTLTAEAANQLKKMRDDGNLKANAVIRISVAEGNYFKLKNGGDKRYRYTLVVDDEPRNLEEYFTMQSQGLTVQVDKPSGDFLQGTELQWVEHAGKWRFKFQNPNELKDDDDTSQSAPSTPLVPVADPKNSEKSSGPPPEER